MSEEETMQNEICANCGQKYESTITLGPGIKWCHRCGAVEAEGIGMFIPYDKRVPASFIDKVRAMCESVGSCTCHQDYVAMRGRGIMRSDPSCFYCRVDGEIAAVREALAEIDKGE